MGKKHRSRCFTNENPRQNDISICSATGLSGVVKERLDQKAADVCRKKATAVTHVIHQSSNHI